MLLLLVVGLLAAEETYNWAEIRSLLDREAGGGTLTQDENRLLAAARQERARLMAAGRWPPPALADADRRSTPASGLLQGERTGLVPITDGGPAPGLYGEGRNQPDDRMRQLEQRLLADVVPRAADGSPASASAGGRIGVISIGMSNTSQEWQAFQVRMAGDEALGAGVVLIDGALGWHDAYAWGSGDDPDPWLHLERKIADAGLKPAQVQAAWVKHALRLPQEHGSHHRRAFTAELRIILAKLHVRLPHLRVAHLSSRGYGGWDARQMPASPEPFAHESAFAIRDLILAQDRGEWSLNPDPQAGAVLCPLLRWGPYLWADGVTPRLDGLSWPREAFEADGVHPSAQGEKAVAELLRAFYMADPSARWIRK